MNVMIKNLEFNNLLEYIAAYACNEDTVRFITGIVPLENIDEIKKRFNHIKNIIRIIKKEDFHIRRFPSIRVQLKKIRPAGSILEPGELRDIMVFLETAVDTFRDILLNCSQDFFNLPDKKDYISHDLDIIKKILKRLKDSIDSEANIRDDASSKLMKISKKMREIETKIKKNLEDIMEKKDISPLLQERFITKRSGRWVIPVKIDSKRKVPGIIHDVSRSGDTAFIEPIDILPLSQRLEDLEAEQRIEEIRILRDLTDEIKNNAGILERVYEWMVYIDAIHSISRTAIKLRLNIPEITMEQKIVLSNARHPLLIIHKGFNEVIPFSLELGEDNIIMVITGPNAGGKTVTLKTIGLITVMALSGLPVSADESTKIPFLKRIIVDMGDGQSLDEGLSTFSYHLKNINEAINEPDKESLILIDEIGRGTSPQEGSALACAIIEELKKKRILTFITTHLDDIKLLTMNMDSVIIASMEFDEKNLKPTYTLKIGIPSPSYGIEMARRLGLKNEITERALNHMGTSTREIYGLLQNLKKKQKEYETLIEEYRIKSDLLEKRLSEIDEKLRLLDEEKKRLIKKATEESIEFVRKTRRDINLIIEEFKKGKGQSIVLKEIKSIEDSLQKRLNELSGDDSIREDLHKGDYVRIRSLKIEGTVSEIKGEKIRVMVNGKDIEVPLTDTVKIKDKTDEFRMEGKDNLSIYFTENNDEIILKGMRVDDAIRELEKSLNHAFISERSSLKIIHGKGTGNLMKAVRKYLESHPFVKSIRSGLIEEGGDGVTIAELR